MKTMSRFAAYFVNVCLVCLVVCGSVAISPLGQRDGGGYEQSSININEVSSQDLFTAGAADAIPRRRLQNMCEEDGYGDRTLKLAYEQPFAGLFLDAKGQTVYELSAVGMNRETGMAFAVCDSSWALSEFDPKLQSFHPENVHIGDPFGRNEVDGDSGYEGVFGFGKTAFALREAIEDDNGIYRAVIEELQVADNGNDYTLIEACPSEFEFESGNKGFEGAEFIKSLDNEYFVVGLCEGNFCGNGSKNSDGNGVSVIMKKEILDDGSCQWSTYRELEIPSSADFSDYSDIAIRETNGRVAIISQEDSKMWLGRLAGQNSEGLWDIDAMEFDTTQFDVYDFPRDNDCNKIYCNVEGIHWLNDDLLIMVSDKMKGNQDSDCQDKDQSVHIFVLP